MRSAPENREPAADQAASSQRTDMQGSKSEGNTTAPKLSPQTKWKQANPVALWSHSATRSAIRRGLLTPPAACEQCGKPGKLDAHHDVWTAPLDVQFWCRSCQRRHHAAERRKAGAS